MTGVLLSIAIIGWVFSWVSYIELVYHFFTENYMSWGHNLVTFEIITIPRVHPPLFKKLLTDVTKYYPASLNACSITDFPLMIAHESAVMDRWSFCRGSTLAQNTKYFGSHVLSITYPPIGPFGQEQEQYFSHTMYFHPHLHYVRHRVNVRLGIL